MVRGRQDCDQSQNGAMQEDFTDCATKLAHAHHLTREDMDQSSQLEAATCLLISQTIGECGKAWEQCHGREDIRKMKDMYINHLVSQYGGGDDGIDVNRCEAVREYRESGRQDEEYRDEDLCTSAKNDELSHKFQKCSHSTSSAAYQNVMDVSDPTSITETLCKALTTIGTVCVKILKECYNKEDLERTKNDHLKEMKSFLMQIVVGKIKNDSLLNCVILKNIDHPVEYEEEVFEDYDKTNDINGNQPIQVTTTTEKHQEVLQEESNLENIEIPKEDMTLVTEKDIVVVEVQEVNNAVKSTTKPPKVIDVPPKNNKVPLKKSIQFAVKEETVAQQKQTRDTGNSASYSGLGKTIIALSIVLFSLSRYL